MAQSLYTLDNITYVAGRAYNHGGKRYEPGDVVEGAREFRNVEAMVRSRHLIPVVRNHNDVPVYYQKDVKRADLVELKYKLTIKWPKAEKPVEPPRPAPPVVRPLVEEKPRKKPGPKPKKEKNDE